MQLYAILRRNGWQSGEELQRAAERSTAEGERMEDDIRWIRSYVLAPADRPGPHAAPAFTRSPPAWASPRAGSMLARTSAPSEGAPGGGAIA
jgi:hypothetical protein